MSIVDRSEIQKLHSHAMELAERADGLRAKGSPDAAEVLLVQAYEQEALAARKFSDAYGDEPTRSVLLRSAASLAIECGLWREAEKLAALGLAGNPPAGLADELRDLLEQVSLSGQLRAR